MAHPKKRAVTTYRKRMKRRGLVRLEVKVRREDAPLVRSVVGALADPGRATEARAFLRDRFTLGDSQGLKTLLAAAPLGDIDLARVRDAGREVEL